MSIIKGRKHPAPGRHAKPSKEDYPHFEQIIYSISRQEAPVPGREAVMRRGSAGIEQDFVWVRNNEAVKGSTRCRATSLQQRI
jgi:hypothetical protein